MRDSAMAPNSAVDAPTVMFKRVSVVIWALAHLAVTVYVLHVLFDGSAPSTTDAANCVREFSPIGQPEPVLTEQQRAYRKAALEFRRQAAPLLLIMRVKDIEAEIQALQAAQQGEKLVDTDSQGPDVAATVGDATSSPTILPPGKCHPEVKTDYDGVAVRWGLTFHVGSAAECCNACAKQAAYASGKQLKCNVWVFCPEKKGCPSPDGYKHKFGECWLKHSADKKPRAVVRDYSAVTGKKSASSALPVLWISGVTPAPHQ